MNKLNITIVTVGPWTKGHPDFLRTCNDREVFVHTILSVVYLFRFFICSLYKSFVISIA